MSFKKLIKYLPLGCNVAGKSSGSSFSFAYSSFSCVGSFEHAYLQQLLEPLTLGRKLSKSERSKKDFAEELGV